MTATRLRDFSADKRVITLAQAKISPAAPDAEIIAEARELGAIIVTANGDDYGKEIKRFLQKSQKNDCYDLFGLVVIPNPAAIQERVLPDSMAKPSHGMTCGAKIISSGSIPAAPWKCGN